MAEYPIIMKQKNDQGNYDTLCPKTLGGQVEGMTLDQVSGNLNSSRIEGSIPSSQITGTFPANQISYNNSQTSSIISSNQVQGAIDQLFTSVSNGKSLIASAITDKGVSTSASDTFAQMAENIGSIQINSELYSSSKYISTLSKSVTFSVQTNFDSAENIKYVIFYANSNLESSLSFNNSNYKVIFCTNIINNNVFYIGRTTSTANNLTYVINDSELNDNISYLSNGQINITINLPNPSNFINDSTSARYHIVIWK